MIVDELTLVEVDSPEALRQAADVLDAEAEALRERARETAIEAVCLRRRALEVEHKPPPHPLDDFNGHRPVAERILGFLRDANEPQKMSAILAVVEDGEAHTRLAIEKLIERKLIVREGLKRGTTYRPPEDGEEVEGPPTTQRYETVVRDAARRLGTFTFAELRAEVPNLSDQTLRRWLPVWVEQGALEETRVGNKKLYAVVKPGGESPTHAPRWDPKPWELPHGGARVGPKGRHRSRGPRAGRSEVRDLLSACTAQGATYREGKHGYLVTFNGQTGSIPKTASDHHSLDNAKAYLRNLGLSV